MAFQPAPFIVGVEIRAEYLQQQVENTLYFMLPATPTLSDVQEIAEQVSGWWVTSVMPNLSVVYTLREVYARSLETAAAPEYIDTTNAGDVGGQVTEALPGNVTWSIQFRTGLTGRSYRGRNYIVGLTAGAITGNQLEPSFAESIVEAYEDLLTVQAAFDWNWVVLSRVQGGVVLANALGANVITIGYADLNLDSQRRRLTGRGD